MRFLKEKDFEDVKDESLNIEFLWPVFSHNECKEDEVPEPEVRAKGIKKLYEPLVEYPALFLKLARLGENYEKINLKTVKKWVQKYGVLGKGNNPPLFKEDSYNLIEGRVSNFQPLSDFRRRVYFAHKILTLYEAVLTHNEKILRDKIKIKEYPNKPGSYYYDVMGENLEDRFVEKYIPGVPTKLDKFVQLDQLQIEKFALGYVFIKTTGELQKYGTIPNCPIINFDDRSERGYSITPTWSFPNLWTCMLMTFYWLLIEVNNKVRCNGCGNLFTRKKHSKALYCPDCRKDKEPRKNDYYYRKKKMVKLAKEGYSIEEIKRKLPRARKSTIESTIEDVEDGKI